jgi:hypothetical protein
MMEGVITSETSVKFYQTTRRNISEESYHILHLSSVLIGAVSYAVSYICKDVILKCHALENSDMKCEDSLHISFIIIGRNKLTRAGVAQPGQCLTTDWTAEAKDSSSIFCVQTSSEAHPVS